MILTIIKPLNFMKIILECSISLEGVSQCNARSYRKSTLGNLSFSTAMCKCTPVSEDVHLYMPTILWKKVSN